MLIPCSGWEIDGYPFVAQREFEGINMLTFSLTDGTERAPPRRKYRLSYHDCRVRYC
jgi:hypothetical protein